MPSRKALALVRLADPHLPFVAVSPHMRAGDLSAVLRGLPDGVPSISDPAQLPGAAHPRTRAGAHAPPRRRRAPAARHPAGDRRPPRRRAGARPRCATACWPRSATRWAGPSAPSGARTARCCAASRCGRRPAPAAPVAELASQTHELTYAAGQGLPGRVWAFRRAVWMGELPGQAVRAGLVTAAAFPIALGDECVGVIELYASDAREPNAEVSALFATVGGQLASYLARRRVRARARRSFDGAERARRRARRRRPRGDRQRHGVRGAGPRRGRVARPRLVRRSPSPRPSAPPPARRSRACWPASGTTLAVDARRALALVAVAATPTACRSACSAGASPIPVARAPLITAWTAPRLTTSEACAASRCRCSAAALLAGCGEDEPHTRRRWERAARATS